MGVQRVTQLDRRVSVRLPGELYERAAQEPERSVSQVLRLALRRYLDEKEKANG